MGPHALTPIHKRNWYTILAIVALVNTIMICRTNVEGPLVVQRWEVEYMIWQGKEFVELDPSLKDLDDIHFRRERIVWPSKFTFVSVETASHVVPCHHGASPGC